MNLSDIKSEKRDGIVYVAMRGDIDLSDTSELRDRLTASISNEAHGLVLDLREVGYIDSAGIHLLHHLRGNLLTRGQRLGLVVNADSAVHHALRLSGVPWFSELCDSPERARALVTGRQSCTH